jgi:hypothetical protein
MSAIESTVPSNRITKTLVQIFAGMILGAVCGGGLMLFVERMHVAVKHMAWADSLALWIAICFLGGGVMLYFVTFNRRKLAENLEGQGARLPATDAEVRSYRLQCLTLMLAGVMLMLPVLAMSPAWSAPASARLVFTLIVVLFVLQTAANVLLWRASDEFLRAQMMACAAITFAVGQGALFLWAAAEHMHLARPISSWDTITLLMTLYVATGLCVSIRSRLCC